MLRRLLLVLLPLLVARGLGSSTLTAAGPFTVFEDAPVASISLLIDASGEKAAAIMQAPKTGNIRTIYVYLGTVTTGQTLKLSLQDVDLATGDPDGVVDQSCTVAVADTDDNMWKSCTLGADRAVTVGDLIAVVTEFNADVGNLNVLSINVQREKNVYTDLFTSSWTKQSRRPLTGLAYDNGSFAYIPGTATWTDATVSVSTSTDPDEYGNIWTPPVALTVSGLTVEVNAGTGAFDLVIYDSGSSVVAGPYSVDKDVRSGTGVQTWLFAAPLDLTGGSVYRLIVKPSTTTAITIRESVFAATAALDQVPFGQALHRTQRTDEGAWSQTTTKQVRIYPLISKIHDGAASGGAHACAGWSE